MFGGDSLGENLCICRAALAISGSRNRGARENSLVDFHTGAVEGDVALIACDGLCDVSSSQEATDVVRKGLVENADDPVRAGREPLFNSSRRPRVARRLTAVVPALRPAEPEGIS